MKKRVFCLLLSALMLAFCFVGCAEKDRSEVMEKIGQEASEGAVRLAMYLVSEKPVSAEQEKLMEEAVTGIQSIIDLPLQIDTSDTEAMERGLRLYNGKPMLNSVNGKKESMESVFPIAKKYSAGMHCNGLRKRRR